MKSAGMDRRQFLSRTSTGVAAAAALGQFAPGASGATKLAVKGGSPVRSRSFPSWPVWDRSAEDHLLSILRSGNWFRGRGRTVAEFEKQYAALLGAKRCVCTVNGTNALLTALHMLDVGVGDEVIVSPYTFIATYNVVFGSCALPVFVDTDLETFQLDADKIEQRITDRTRAILPVHILGFPANMDKIMAIAKKYNLIVIEDACQAWLAEWRGRKLGTIGNLGCFSFQNSKHLPCGEGGAVIGNNEELMDRVYAYHNCGRPYGTIRATSAYPIVGTNKRLTEYQAAVLLSQIQRLESDTARRIENARHLTSRISEIPGIEPMRHYEGMTRGVYHLYAFRYLAEHFAGAPRSRFLEALRAEGIPCSGGYGPQYRDGVIEAALQSKNFKRAFPAERLRRYRRQLHYPQNDLLCQQAVWLTQNLLLGSRTDVDDIADAIIKIYENRKSLA